MKTPLTRIRLGAIVLGSVVIAAVLAYRWAGYDWLGAVWMTVVTISSVGYAERSEATVSTQVISLGVILVGMSAAVYTIGGFLQMMTEGEIERALVRQRLTRGIERLNHHVVICGFGRMGRLLADEMNRIGRPFVVVDHSGDLIAEAQSRGYLYLQGDATDEEVLIEAGVQRAETLVSALPQDAANVFITLTGRNLNPNMQIIARADHHTTERKLRQAGADKIVMPTLIGAQQMVRLITRPSTADLMNLVAESSFLDLDLDEITVPADNPLVGTSVRETEVHRKHRLLVVAVKQDDGSMIFNPDAEYTFQENDVAIIMGRIEDIDGFRKQYHLEV